MTVEMEIVETAIFTEYVLGQTLAKAKVLGELRDGRPKKTMLDEHRFSLKDAGITNHESEHAQRFVEYVERFDLESFQLLVREHKLNRTLSRSGIYKTIDQALRRLILRSSQCSPGVCSKSCANFDRIPAKRRSRASAADCDITSPLVPSRLGWPESSVGTASIFFSRFNAPASHHFRCHVSAEQLRIMMLCC